MITASVEKKRGGGHAMLNSIVLLACTFWEKENWYVHIITRQQHV